MASDLAPEKVQEALSTRWLGRNYIHLNSVGSTNVLLKEMASGPGRPLPEGTLLLAEYQSQGRGRLDRRWSAAPGTSLLFSLLFRPDWPPEQLQWLMMMASLATAGAIEGLIGLEIGIKWPNDVVILVEGAWHKTGGLLLDIDRSGSDRTGTAVLGIGLNVNMAVHQLPETITPATSLLIATGSRHSRLTLLCDLLARLEAYYQEAGGGVSPRPAWRKRLVNLGNPVHVTLPGQKIPLIGIAEEVDAWGRLQVRDASGQLHVVTAGDVSWPGHR